MQKLIFLLSLFIAYTVYSAEMKPAGAGGGGGGADVGEPFVVAGSLSAGLSAERLFGCDAQDLVCADPGANGTFAVAFLRTATLAGNPVLAAGECVFSTTGLICEGSTADTIEGLLTLTDPATTDKTWTLPNLTGTFTLDTSTLVGDVGGTPAATVIGADKVTSSMVAFNYAGSASEGGAATTATALAANGANCTAGNYPLGVDASGAVESCTAASGSGDITTVGTCTTGDCAIEGGNDMFPFIYEGTPNTFETTFSVTDPTADNAIVFPNIGGTVVTTGDTGSVTNTMLAGSIAGSKLTNDTLTLTQIDETSAYAFSALGATTSTVSVTTPILASSSGDVADAGVIRLLNADLIGWEASPASTDITMTVNAAEEVAFSGNLIGMDLGNNAGYIQFATTRRFTGETANTIQCCAADSNSPATNVLTAPDAVSGVSNGSIIAIAGGAKSSTGTDGDQQLGVTGQAGNTITAGTAPTLSACGTTPSISGSPTAGKITIGTGVTTSCTVTFVKAHTNAPACVVVGDNAAVIYNATTSTTAMTIISSLDMASDVLSYICLGY